MTFSDRLNRALSEAGVATLPPLPRLPSLWGTTKFMSHLRPGTKGHIFDDMSFVTWDIDSRGNPHHGDQISSKPEFQEKYGGKKVIADLGMHGNGNSYIRSHTTRTRTIPSRS